ncbi:Leucine Rich repeats (2 copies) [Neorhodopirellula pilleata]|uniref:Leucine Rich repeats (2 copies) n=2 Tax=Neorhodopirellula pilleata TaxID=2714738 RepID=A0A5C6AHU5_9BACT|nr:Leucine Rich repeats (2 copies) [Neorhodopirellula pilleata]
MAKIPAKYIPGKFSLASWPAWIQMVVACLAGAFFGGYAASSAVLLKQEEAMERQLTSGAMDHFVRLGGEIIRQPEGRSPEGNPLIRRLGFYAIGDAFELQKAVFCGGTLPTAKELDFAPIGANQVGKGVVDGTLLRIVARNFPAIEYLDVSNCRVADLTAIQAMPNLKVLKLTNNPLEYAELQAFKQVKNVNELWIGWPDLNLEKDSLYRNPEVIKNLLKSVSEMPSLKKLYLYDIRLKDSDRKLLEGIEVINARMN